jgi:hypothetical protein
VPGLASTEQRPHQSLELLGWLHPKLRAGARAEVEVAADGERTVALGEVDLDAGAFGALAQRIDALRVAGSETPTGERHVRDSAG